jgi:hypothetical protein
LYKPRRVFLRGDVGVLGRHIRTPDSFVVLLHIFSRSWQ